MFRFYENCLQSLWDMVSFVQPKNQCSQLGSQSQVLFALNWNIMCYKPSFFGTRKIFLHSQNNIRFKETLQGSNFSSVPKSYEAHLNHIFSNQYKVYESHRNAHNPAFAAYSGWLRILYGKYIIKNLRKEYIF